MSLRSTASFVNRNQQNNTSIEPLGVSDLSVEIVKWERDEALEALRLAFTFLQGPLWDAYFRAWKDRAALLPAPPCVFATPLQSPPTQEN